MNKSTIKCNKCGNEIEISEAIKSELEGKIIKEINEKHEKEIEDIKHKVSENAKKQAIDKVRKEYDSRIKITKEESAEQEKQNKELQEQASDLIKQLRETKNNKDKLKIEYEKKLLDEQDKIKQEAKKETTDEMNLKMSEKDKKLTDMTKQLQEMKRKMEQGSQQAQGEIFELKLEDKLKNKFPYDEIKKVPKGINGADIIQIVKTPTGTKCGTIVWESKNTKSWSKSWISKLKDDQRKLKAEIAILISIVIPENINHFGPMENIWVSDYQSSISLVYALREQLIKIKNTEQANRGRTTKAETVYNYLVSNEFKQRVEVWIEYFKNRKSQIDKERMYFNKKWGKEEKDVLKVMTNTAGIYGDLQGLSDESLPKIDYLELPEKIEDEK